MLDVFILSYNRAEFLPQTLACFWEQSFQDFRITVLDNASTDNTAEVIAGLQAKRPFRFIQQAENIGVFRNFMQVRDLVQAPWVMIFHDDDLLHPRALELAFSALKQHRRASLCGMNYTGVVDPVMDNFATDVEASDYLHFDNQVHFASYCYTDNAVAFSSCIYRSVDFRRLEFDDTPYGKLWDRPAMVQAMGEGEALVLRPILVLYRLHAGQDSQASKSGPFLPNAIALIAFYAGLLGGDWGTSSGRCFVINNRAVLKSFYKWCSDRGEVTFNGFVARARKAGAATGFSFVPRPLSRLLKKWHRKRDRHFF